MYAPSPPKNVSEIYWVNEDDEKLGRALATRVEDYGKGALTKEVLERCARAYSFYFGLSPESGAHETSLIVRAGDQGELAKIRVNHARSLVNTLRNLITSNRLVWQATATNVDYDSLRAVELAQAVLEYYWKVKSISELTSSALEEALVFSEGFVLGPIWQPDAGADVTVDPETGQIVKSGDVAFRNVSSWDVIRDSNKRSWKELDWVIVQVPTNRWDLMADHPECAREIHSEEVNRARATLRTPSAELSDDIPVYHFFHRRTRAVPKGKECLFLKDGTLLGPASPLRYDDIPLYRVAASEITGTPFGYTSFYDVLGLQELIDDLHSSAATNLTTFGVQNIAVEEGSQFSPEDVSGGMRVIYYPPGGKPPAPLQLTASPPELYQHLDRIKGDQEQIFGVNSVVRGEPQSGEQSGSALALLQAQVLQQSSELQASNRRLTEALGQALVSTLRRYLATEQTVEIAGKANRYLVSEPSYSGKSFERIKQVSVEIGNPLSQTPAGRIEMAKEMLNLGVVKTPEQYEQVLTTGKLEPLTQGLHHQLLLIKSENEQLSRGEAPPALAVDDHQLHAREHASVLANPEARRNPAVVETVLGHIREHEELLYTTNPQTLMLVGLQPPMPMGMPPGPGGAPPDPSQGGPGPDGGAPPSAPNGPLPGGPQPQEPNPPTNPATGQPWDPQTGGGATQQ